MKRAFGILCSAILILPTAAPAADPAANEAKPKREKMICKRQVQKGTLAYAKKVCFTQAQWDAIRNDGRELAADLQGKGFTNCEGSDPNGPNC